MATWDELRFLLAIERAGSIRKAAQALGVNHATVSRRLQGYEARLGARLFERIGHRLELTPAGADAVETAQRIDVQVHDVERRIAGGDLRLEGTIRVALPPSLLGQFGPIFAAFTRAYPQVELEFATGLARVNLSRRDADVALRITGQPQSDLFGRRVGSMVARAWVDRRLHERVKDLPMAEWPWVDWVRRLGEFPTARWLRDELQAPVVARFESGRDLADAVGGGIGAGFLLDPSPAGLVRVPGAPEFALSLWVVTHNDLRNVARIRAFLRLVGDRIATRLAGQMGG